MEQANNNNPGGTETLLDNEHVENILARRIAIAPVKERNPQDLTMDEDSKELPFPIINCGQ